MEVVKRSGSVVFADSKRTLGVVADMIVPSYTHDDKDWSIGGVMCVPLKSITIAGTKTDLSSFKIKDYGVVLAIDTGSEGYFVIDDTGGQEQPSVSELVAEGNAPMGDGLGDYELTIETKNGGEFVIRSPEQWRSGEAGQMIRRRPFRTAEPAGPGGSGTASRSQMFMVGNAWLQAIAVTFCPRANVVYFAHLDSSGRRSEGYMGPRSPPRGATAAVAMSALQSTPSGHLPPFWQDSGYLGASLTSLTYPAASVPPGAPPPQTDLELPIQFMASPPGGSITDERVETTDPAIMSEPCLSATFPTIGGGSRKITQVLDTGSGINIVMGGTTTPNVSVMADECPECGCVGTGGKPTALGALFRAYNPAAGDPHKCSNPARDAKCGAGCCSECCLGAQDVQGKPLSPSTSIQCAVSYCTGMLQYSPSFATADFGTTFKNVRVFLGRGAAVCEPAVRSGLWGCWFWINQEKTKSHEDKDDVIQHSSTLPFYVLRAMRQESGEMSNMTFKFWRSDLAKCEGAESAASSPPPKSSTDASGDVVTPDSTMSDVVAPDSTMGDAAVASDSTMSGDADSKPKPQSSMASLKLDDNRNDDALRFSHQWGLVGIVMVIVCLILFAVGVLASLWRIGSR